MILLSYFALSLLAMYLILNTSLILYEDGLTTSVIASILITFLVYLMVPILLDKYRVDYWWGGRVVDGAILER